MDDKNKKKKNLVNPDNSNNRIKSENNNFTLQEEERYDYSTENTRKRILPERKNRGIRMKVLQGKELEEEDEIYNLLFGEKSSDEDFNISNPNEEDSFDSDFDNNDDASGENQEQKTEEVDADKIAEEETKKEAGIFEDFEESNIKSKKKEKAPKRRKAFIDEDDDDYLKRKRKSYKTNNIKKAKKIKSDDIDNDIEVDIDQSSENDELMQYNDVDYKKKIILEEENTKKEKAKLKEKETVRYSYMQDKPSQRDLLFEAIFTEIYNKKSLEEMQRLEDLNKRESASSNKKQFNEYVRFFKTRDENKLPNHVLFSNPDIYNKIFENFNRKIEPKEKNFCAITGEPAKYFDPLTKQYYSTIEGFKILRERYFQKEEDGLLFRIQTLSDLASQKKEKLKKIILSNDNGNTTNTTKNIITMVNKYGILKNENVDFEKKITSHRIYNRNRENCIESGMLISSTAEMIVISKKIFKDKHSNLNRYMLEDKYYNN